MPIDFQRLPANLPVPTDDGAANHLKGARLPDIELPATVGPPVRLSTLHDAIIFSYPRTGSPEHPPGPDWDAIPGARGCTPHSCGYRDLHHEFEQLGVAVLGLSTQTTPFQQEFAARTHFPFPILSDTTLQLTRLLNLPTFEFSITPLGGGGPDTLLKRMAWFITNGTIEHLWYPVFPPDQNAQIVLAWLKERECKRT